MPNLAERYLSLGMSLKYIIKKRREKKCVMYTFLQDLHNHWKALGPSLVTSDFSKPLSILVNTCYLMAPAGIATGTTWFVLHPDSWGFGFSKQ